MSIKITDLDDDDDDDDDYKSSSNDPIAWQRSQSSGDLQTSVNVDDDDDDVDARNLPDESPNLCQSTPVVIRFDVRDDTADTNTAASEMPIDLLHATSATIEMDRSDAAVCTVMRARSEPAVARLSCRSTYQRQQKEAASTEVRRSKPGRVRSYLRRCRDALIGSGSATSTSPNNTSVCPITHHEPIEQRPQHQQPQPQQQRYTTSWYVDETCTASDADAEEDVYTDCCGVLASADDADVDTDAETSLADEDAVAAAAAAAIDLTASHSVACQSTAAAVADEDCSTADEALHCEPDQLSQSSADTVLDVLDSGTAATALADKLIAEQTQTDDGIEQQVSACKCVEH